MVYGCLKHSAPNTPGRQEISYSYWTSKLEHYLKCFQNNLLPGYMLEAMLKAKPNKTGFCLVLYLHASLKPYCCALLLLPNRGYVAYKTPLLWISFLPHFKQPLYGGKGVLKWLNMGPTSLLGLQGETMLLGVSRAQPKELRSDTGNWLITAE